MVLSNSYARAFLVGAVIFVGAAFRYYQMYGPFKDTRHVSLALSMGGFAFVITSLLVGTFSRRSDKPWSWLKLIVVCIGCWLGVLMLLLLIQVTFYAR